MKKIIIIAILLVLSIPVFSQLNNGGFEASSGIVNCISCNSNIIHADSWDGIKITYTNSTLPNYFTGCNSGVNYANSFTASCVSGPIRTGASAAHLEYRGFFGGNGTATTEWLNQTIQGTFTLNNRYRISAYINTLGSQVSLTDIGFRMVSSLNSSASAIITDAKNQPVQNAIVTTDVNGWINLTYDWICPATGSYNLLIGPWGAIAFSNDVNNNILFQYNVDDVSISLCNEPADLYSRDLPSDVGNEPDNVGTIMWVSEDIWVRNLADGGLVHQNPEFSNSGLNPVTVYVRIRNRGCLPSSGNIELRVYWAKASTGLGWPTQWVNYNPIPSSGCNLVKYGDEITDPSNPIYLPVIPPGGQIVIPVQWLPSNPNDFACFGADKSHFCLLARIETSQTGDFGMTFPETPDLYSNVKNNNNIVWKNVEIVDNDPSNKRGFIMGNSFNTTKIKKLQFSPFGTNNIFNQATIKIKLSLGLYLIWEAGGKQGNDFEELTDSSIKLLAPEAVINNLTLGPNTMFSLSVQFIPLQESDSTEQILDIVQYDQVQNQVEGGVRFLVKLNPSPLNIPTLTQWGIIMLSMMLLMIAWFYIPRK